MEEIHLHKMIASYLADVSLLDLADQIIIGKGRNPGGACASLYERVHIHEFILTHINTKSSASACITLPICV